MANGEKKLIKHNRNLSAASVKTNAFGWLLILPALLMFVLIVWRPVVIAFTDAFYKIQGVERIEFVGFKNFIDVLTDENFLKALGNTARYVLWSLVIGLPLPLITAVMLNEMVHTKNTFNVLMYLPCVIPAMATYLIWKMVYSDGAGGLLNMIIMFFGKDATTWLSDSKKVIPLIIISMTWNSFGGSVILYLSILQGVDKNLYEAARLDGAGIFTRIRVVMMPNIYGILLLNTIRQIIGVFQIYEQPLTMTGGGPNGASQTLGLMNYYYAFKYGQFDKSMALGVITFLLLVWLTLIYFRLDKKIND